MDVCILNKKAEMTRINFKYVPVYKHICKENEAQ